jgi:threonine dehydrogenase-like Zn-dependent dehydrogenase
MRTSSRRLGRNRAIRSSTWRSSPYLVYTFLFILRRHDVTTKNVNSGAGPIGLTTLLSARAAGAEPIVITDLFQNRLDFAKELVPSVRTVLISRNTTSKEQAAQVKEAAGGPLGIALECTGVEGSIHTAIYVSSS